MIRWSLASLAVGALLAGALVFGPEAMLSRQPDDWMALEATERFALENQARTVILQAFGALLVMAGAITGFRQLGLAREQNRLDRRAKLVVSLSGAVDQVTRGDDTSAIAGLRALKRIALIEPEEVATVIQIVSAFVRQAGGSRSAMVRESAVRVGADLATDAHVLNLEGANLSGTNLGNLSLDGAKLARADLREASMVGVSLRGADLSRADLSRVDFSRAHIADAVFTGARVNGAITDASTRGTLPTGP